jgi:hypothetical protein
MKRFLAVILGLHIIFGINYPGFCVEIQVMNNLVDSNNKVVYNNASKLVEENRLPCAACTQRNATLDKCEALGDNTQDTTEKFGRTCNANCLRCYKGHCVYQSNTQDLFNHCTDANCANIVWGWNNNSCNRYNNSSTMIAGAYCDGFGACGTAQGSDCSTETEGGTLASCGSAGCKKACPTGAPIANYNSVDEICYTDNLQHNCSGGYMCNATGYCVSAPVPKRVFVSSIAVLGGSVGGVNGFDNNCQNLANNSNQNLSGSTWKAWVSNSGVNAKDRIADAANGYYLVDNTTKIANNLADLTDGSLLNAINKNQNGVTTTVSVWTGTNEAGMKGLNNCQEWLVGVLNGRVGNSSYTNGKWTNNSEGNCGLVPAYFYCFEQ